jgi:hypothetical protein
MKAVADVFPDKTPIDRTSTNAWADIRVVQAGATPINWVAVVCEWAPDFTSDERHKVNPAVMKNGAGVGLAWNRLSPRARPAGRAAPNTNAGGNRWRNRSIL